MKFSEQLRHWLQSRKPTFGIRIKDSESQGILGTHITLTNKTDEGGAAILIDNSVPHSRVTLNTTLNCVAVRLKIGHTQVSAMSLYIPPSAANPTPQILDDLVTQIPAPVLFMGDVNAQHPAWGGDQRDTRGNIFENFIKQTQSHRP